MFIASGNVLFAFGLNAWLMTHYEVVHLPPIDVAAGVLAMLAIGQAAVVRARRASRVSPVVAMRSAW